MPDIIKKIRGTPNITDNEYGSPMIIQHQQSEIIQTTGQKRKVLKDKKKYYSDNQLDLDSNKNNRLEIEENMYQDIDDEDNILQVDKSISNKFQDQLQFEDNIPQAESEYVEGVLDPQFCTDIEEYLKNCLNNNEDTIDMSDFLIQDYGAKLVATTAPLCDNLKVVRLKQCRISDHGAIELFQELKDHQTLEFLDLSYNPITDKCFDALVELLEENTQIVVNL